MKKKDISFPEHSLGHVRIDNQDMPHRSASDTLAGRALPLSIQQNFVMIPASLTVRETLFLIQTRHPQAVVIRRRIHTEPLFYLFSPPEIQSALTGKNPEEAIEQALDLHETGRAEMLTAPQAARETGTGPVRRTVVTDKGSVVGYAGLSQPVSDATKARLRDLKSIVNETFAISKSMEKADYKTIGTRRGKSSRFETGADMPKAPKAPARSAPPAKAGKRKSTSPGKPAAKSSKKRSLLPCHFAAQMPETITAGKAQQVEVTISRDEIDLITGKTVQKGSAPLAAKKPEQKITVRLIPKLNLEVAGDARADVTAPLPGEPVVRLYFDVRSDTVGESELWVAFCQGPVSLVTLKLQPRVVDNLTGAKGKPLQTKTSIESPAGPPARINILRVYLNETGGKIRYRYTLWLDDLGVDQEYESPEFKGDITTILKPYLNLFDEVETENSTDFEQLQIQLRSIGATLFQTLFPKDMQSVFWENRDRITHLKLYCEEPYIPWELLHVCEPGKPLPAETRFLGQMGLVRWLYGHTAPTELRVRPGRAWYVTPSYPGNELESAKKEGKLLSNLFQAKPVKPATRPEVTKLLSAEGPFDLFHFAGHGEASEAQITEGRIELEAAGSNANSLLRDLTPDIVSGLCQLKAQDGTRPIVVLNSCRAGKTGYQITGLGGFAPAFLEREAGVFVGALWMIGDQPALTFIQTFYETLNAGKTVAQAVNNGREKARKAGDATYLAYVVYADPFARLVH